MSADVNEDKLRHAAKCACGDAGADFVGFVPVVVETSNGQGPWEGTVSLFNCTRGRVYAWAAVNGEAEPQYFAVLHRPPAVDSPSAAVRAWLAFQAKK